MDLKVTRKARHRSTSSGDNDDGDDDDEWKVVVVVVSRNRQTSRTMERYEERACFLTNSDGDGVGVGDPPSSNGWKRSSEDSLTRTRSSRAMKKGAASQDDELSFRANRASLHEDATVSKMAAM